MNGRIHRRVTALKTLHAQKFFRGERTQRKFGTSAMGSLETFAARCIEDCFMDFADPIMFLPQRASPQASLSRNGHCPGQPDAVPRPYPTVRKESPTRAERTLLV